MNLPMNLPLLLTDPRPEAVEAVSKILQSENKTPEDIMVELSRYWKLKVTFSEPVTLQTIRHWVCNEDNTKSYITHKTNTIHIIHRVFKSKIGSIGYAVKHNNNRGYIFNSFDKIVSFEPIITTKRKDTFDSYEEFEKRFDLKFITKNEIQKLWNSTSAQHGGKYNRSDFRPLSKAGRQVMKMFLQKYVGLDGPSADSGRICFTRRDITISFSKDREFVYYSSEYPGCGNGSYGIVANEHCWLHLEDD